MEKSGDKPRTPFVLQTDPLLLPLIPEYLRNRQLDLGRLADALGRGDFAAMRKLGHDMHGSGGAYGLPPVSVYGREIEDAAVAGDAAGVEAALGRLRLFLETVQLPP